MTGPLMGSDVESLIDQATGSDLPGRIPAQRSGSAGSNETATERNPHHTQVLVVDPDRVTRDSLRRTLSGVGIDSVTVASGPEDIPEAVAPTAPATGEVTSLAIINLAIGKSAPPLIRSLVSQGWQRVLVISSGDDIGPVIDAIGAGATGVAIGRHGYPRRRNVAGAIHELSSREVEVLRMVADGRSNKWIGAELDLSPLTVKSHLARIGRKLGTGDRAHMVAIALRAGVIV